MAPRFINPFSDWGFKHIFGREISKDLLLSFLNDLFSGEFVIKSLMFGNNEQIGLSNDSREVVFDIYCTTDEGKEIIVEMQNRGQEHFIDRALYYSSRVIVNQGEKGKWNYDLLPVYTICFMNFIDPNMPECKFRTDLTLADRDTGKVVSEKLRIIYLMLPLFEKEEGDCENDFERWIFVLRNMNTFERMPFMAKNAVFKKLAEISDIRSLSKKEMDKYEYSLRVMRDSYATYTYAAKNGWKKGVAEGLAQGKAEGIAQGKAEGLAQGKAEGLAQGKAEGIAQGEREKALAIACNLNTLGLSPNQIAEATGLTLDDIKNL